MTTKEFRRVFNCLFENLEEEELVYALYEDMDGYIIFWYCMDPTQQKEKVTKTQFYNRYTRVWE